MSLPDYYSNLLIKQYNGLPKATATIATLAKLVVMDNLPIQVMNAFNITGSNLAQGVQLDTIGKYLGVTRNGYGFNGQPITLNDADFTKLIQLATARDFSGSSLSDIQALIAIFFSGDILVFDYLNMQMSYLLSTTLGSQNLLELFVTEGLLPRPMGVALSVIVAPIITEFFGFRTYVSNTPNNTPFNSYSSYQTDRPWVTYADSISA